jgi:ribonuclease BN (tRNA processing enzyme)
VELVVAGAGPSYSKVEGAVGAAYLVVAEAHALLLDFGHGTFANLAGAWEPADLDAIVITHLRLDALHAQPGFAAETLDIEATGGPGRRQVGPFTLEAALVTHTNESYGYRVSVTDAPDGPGLVYSGDCGRADDLAPLLRPGDALLTEVSFGPGPVPPDAMHLDGPAVGRLAAARDVGQVLLTHFHAHFGAAPTIDSVRALYTGPVRIVAPGDRIAV